MDDGGRERDVVVDDDDDESRVIIYSYTYWGAQTFSQLGFYCLINYCPNKR